MKPYLSVIIPAYNEQDRIGSTLLIIEKYLKKQDYTWEILVVNDGSRDHTANVIRDIRMRIKNLRFINNKKNHGKGYVVRQGMLKARGKIRLFTDADNSTDISHIEKLKPFLSKGFDIVIGSIEVSGAKIHEETGWYKRIFGKWSKLLIRIIALPGIRDSQRGFKLFTAKSARDIFPRQRIMRWGFDIEILAIAKKLNYKIKEIPINWINKGKTEVSPMAYVKTLKELFQIKWNLITGKYR
ncbi:hypothetical protein CL633_04250 [bacterium]|nr:hypothetical protein [bacterium]|tara:strand:+ start:1744 stop:2466 length:723 start_codon:yes stop_codon:yes gene_type:complete